MTQEEKNLFLRDLCARLPYGVIGHYYLNKSLEWGNPEKLIDIDLIKGRLLTEESDYCIEEFILYLRPMGSMTDEERRDFYDNLRPKYDGKPWESLGGDIDWLNAHHFDYRDLIRQGLAIEVTPENNPYENR